MSGSIKSMVIHFVFNFDCLKISWTAGHGKSPKDLNLQQIHSQYILSQHFRAEKKNTNMVA